jgi:hypothetical protein
MDPQDTTTTYDPFTSSGVVTSAVPKTVQDALTVCQNLCINYLWVDALCIVQESDNLTNWKSEALRMC